MKYTALQDAQRGAWRHAVADLDGNTVDLFRTLSGAANAADALNRGRATIQPHNIVGTRIVPRPARPTAVRLRMGRVWV